MRNMECYDKNPDSSAGAGNGHGGKGIGAVCEYAGGECEKNIAQNVRRSQFGDWACGIRKIEKKKFKKDDQNR